MPTSGRIHLFAFGEPVDDPAARARVIGMIHPHLIDVALALPRPIHDGEVHAARMEPVVVGQKAVFLDHVHAGDEENGGLGPLSLRRPEIEIGILAGVEFHLVFLNVAAPDFTHPVETARNARVVFLLPGVPIHGNEVLAAPVAKASAVIVHGGGHVASRLFGRRHRLLLLQGGLFAPQEGNGAPARNLRVDRLEVLVPKAPLIARAHDAGVENVLVTGEFEEIIENPVLIRARCLSSHAATFSFRVGDGASLAPRRFEQI